MHRKSSVISMLSVDITELCSLSAEPAAPGFKSTVRQYSIYLKNLLINFVAMHICK